MRLFLVLLIFLATYKVSFSQCLGIEGAYDASKTVILYEHSNYEGGTRKYALGSCSELSYIEDRNPSVWAGFGFGCGGMCNDCLSSIKIPEGLQLRVWEHRDFQGASTVFKGNIPFVGSEWNDRVSSWRVESSSSGSTSSQSTSSQQKPAVNLVSCGNSWYNPVSQTCYSCQNSITYQRTYYVVDLRWIFDYSRNQYRYETHFEASSRFYCP